VATPAAENSDAQGRNSVINSGFSWMDPQTQQMPRKGGNLDRKLTHNERVTIHTMFKAKRSVEEIMDTVDCSNVSVYKWRYDPNHKYKGMHVFSIHFVLCS